MDSLSRKRAEKIKPSTELLINKNLWQDYKEKSEYKASLEERLKILQDKSQSKIKVMRKNAKVKN